MYPARPDLLGLCWCCGRPHRRGSAAGGEAVSDYDALVAGADQEARVPPPGEVARLAARHLRDPFYDRGPNDKGIGLQLLASLGRVLTGYLLALLVASRWASSSGCRR